MFFWVFKVLSRFWSPTLEFLERACVLCVWLATSLDRSSKCRRWTREIPHWPGRVGRRRVLSRRRHRACYYVALSGLEPSSVLSASRTYHSSVQSAPATTESLPCSKCRSPRLEAERRRRRRPSTEDRSFEACRSRPTTTATGWTAAGRRNCECARRYPALLVWRSR